MTSFKYNPADRDKLITTMQGQHEAAMAHTFRSNTQTFMGKVYEAGYRQAMEDYSVGLYVDTKI